MKKMMMTKTMSTSPTAIVYGALLFSLFLTLQKATAAPEISVDDPLELDLNGSPQAFSIDVRNMGPSGNLTVSSASFGEDPNFTVTSLPDPIIPGDADIIEFVFNPLGERGLFSATLSIESDDPTTPSLPITVSGAIHDPRLSAETLVEIGDSPSNVVTITNIGASQVLSVSSVGSIGADASLFRAQSFPTALAPGASGEFKFVFLPGDRQGTFTNTFRLFSNDPIVRPFLIEVVAVVGERGTLVAWWPLDGDASDASGNGFDGTQVGNLTNRPGANNFTADALEFDGASTRIDVPYSPDLNPDDFTVTLWVKPHSAAAGQLTTAFANRDESPGLLTHGFSLNSSSGEWDFWSGDGDTGWDVLDGPAVDIDAWSHLAITYDSATDTKALYVDGELVASDIVPESGVAQYIKNGTLENEDLHIGAGQDDGLGGWFDGEIDDVALFRVALNHAEIRTVMSSGVRQFIQVDRPFQLTGIRFSDGDEAIVLQWNSDPGMHYAVDRSTDPSAAWNEIRSAEVSMGTVTTYTDTDAPSDEGRVFYRVRLLPQ